MVLELRNSSTVAAAADVRLTIYFAVAAAVTVALTVRMTSPLLRATSISTCGLCRR